MNRFAATRDSNHSEIVEHLRATGLAVYDTSTVGRGFPDIIVSTPFHMWLVEIKGPKGKLRKNQKKFHSLWKGKPIIVARTAEEILDIVAKSFE